MGQKILHDILGRYACLHFSFKSDISNSYNMIPLQCTLDNGWEFTGALYSHLLPKSGGKDVITSVKNLLVRSYLWMVKSNCTY